MMFVLKIIFLVLGILFVAFFEGSETALTSLSLMNLDQLKKRYPTLKLLFESWRNSPEKILASLVLGNTVAVVICGILAASIGNDLAQHGSFSSDWAILAISFVVSLFILLFGEILPKVLGRIHSEKLAPFILIPLVPFTKVIYPVVQIFVIIADLFVKLLGAEPQKEIPTLTPTELKGMLETGGASESKSSSHRILTNIIEFGQLRVQDVLRPIEKVVAVELRKNPKEVIAIFQQTPYSRILAYRDSLNDIIGIIYAKDLLSAWRTEGLILIPDLLRPVYFVPETLLVSELLREFKKGHHHFAVVRDQNKKVLGIITIEDVIEELVGEIYDESKIG